MVDYQVVPNGWPWQGWSLFRINGTAWTKVGYFRDVDLALKVEAWLNGIEQ